MADSCCCPKYLSKFSRSWERFDHGVVSSLIVLRSLTFFLESDISPDISSTLTNEDARQFCIRSEILHAMAAHTNPKVYHLSANTLSFLLVLCDDLHEWARPTMTTFKEGETLGTKTEVTLEKCRILEEESEIRCCIAFADAKGHKEQCDYCMTSFKRWHERLRPAVFDTNRKMVFEWRITFPPETSPPWTFLLDTKRGVFDQVKVEGPTTDFTKTTRYDLYSPY